MTTKLPLNTMLVLVDEVSRMFDLTKAPAVQVNGFCGRRDKLLLALPNLKATIADMAHRQIPFLEGRVEALQEAIEAKDALIARLRKSGETMAEELDHLRTALAASEQSEAAWQAATAVNAPR